MKVHVIYNQYSLDSCLTTCLIKLFYSKLYPNKDYKITTSPDNKQCNLRFIDTPDVLITAGINLDLSYTNIVTELLDNDSKIICFNYEDCGDVISLPVFDNRIKDIHEFKPFNNVKNSLAKLAGVFANKMLLENLDTGLTDKMKLLIRAICHSENFLPMSEEELLILYNNRNELMFCARHDKLFELQPDVFTKIKDVRRIQISRNIILRNISNNRYGDNPNTMLIPTVCVNEEYANDVMRLMSYPYSNVITYEDIKDYRIWRIYSKEQRLLDAISNMIPHRESWYQCKLRYLMSQTPVYK